MAEAVAMVTAAATAEEEVRRNVIREITNVLTRLPIIVTTDIGNMTNTAQTAATIQPEDATAVQAAATQVAEVLRNVTMETINAMMIHHTDAPAAAGLTMNTAQTDATIQQENATAVQAAATQVAEVLRQVQHRALLK